MALLEKLGLTQKRARPVGQKLEKGRAADTSIRRKGWVRAAILLILIGLTLAAYPRENAYHYLVEVGDQWRYETLVAPFDFTIYRDPTDIAAERAQVRRNTPPIFHFQEDAAPKMAANRDTITQQLRRVLDTYVSFLTDKREGLLEEARRDSLRFLSLRRDSWLKVDPERWQILIDSYVAERLPDEEGRTIRRGGVPLYQKLVNDAWEFGYQLAEHGVMDLPIDSIYADQVILSYPSESIEKLVNQDTLFGLNEAFDAAYRHFRNMYEGQPDLASITYSIFRIIFVPSFAYQREYTLEKIQQREKTIWVAEGGVQKGDVIVSKGEQVTPEILRQIRSLEREAGTSGGGVFVWRSMLGHFLTIVAIYLLFFLYLYLLRRQIFIDNRQILLIALLFAGIVGLYAIAIRLPSAAMYAVPVAIASVLLTVMFDSRVGILGTLTLAFIGGGLLRYDFEFAFATVFAGFLGVFSVRDIKNRGQFFLSAGLVFAGYLVVLIASWLIYSTTPERFLYELLLVGINSFLLIMAYPLLWVFERAFDVTTDLTLLELSDTNRPLLKELSLRSPGTFNHSLQVANLAEAAADAIGANALLTRVGALYHDIGKMLKPEYFVENQRPGDNPHDHLKPRMSALIIASHVKEGLELGRQYNLPQRVLKFIPMHHGTTRIEYFYRKAVEQRGPEEPPVQESEFRYPGPRPDGKESGILMLADSVEAASRSLSDPTHKRLETLIEMIFKARIDDRQLDFTELTFRDLNQIKETFLSMLLGIYHVRVKYPGQKEREKKEAAQLQEVAETEANRQGNAGKLNNVKGVVGIPEQSTYVSESPAENQDEAGKSSPARRDSEEVRAEEERAGPGKNELKVTSPERDPFNGSSAEMDSSLKASQNDQDQPSQDSIESETPGEKNRRDA